MRRGGRCPGAPAMLAVVLGALSLGACKRRPVLPALEGPPVVVRERSATAPAVADEQEVEPNDTAAQAQVVLLAAQPRLLQGELAVGAGGKPDTDRFRVRWTDQGGQPEPPTQAAAPAGEPVALLDVLLALDAPLPEGAALGLELSLGERALQSGLVRREDGAAEAVAGLTSIGLRPGQEPVVTLRLRSGAAPVAYRLRFVRRAWTGTEEIEPNETPASASPLTFESATAEVSGRLAVRGDVDHFALPPDVLVPGSGVAVELELPAELTAALSLITSAGRILASAPAGRGVVRLAGTVPDGPEAESAGMLILAVRGARRGDPAAPYLLRVRPGRATGTEP